MRIIPAIDLLNGKCVRLVRGEERSAITYDKPVLDIAEDYVRNGAKLLHIVDLDGAFTGNMKNLPLIKQLASRFPIQVGGGVRKEEMIARLLNMGVKKVVISTLLLYNSAEGRRLKEKYYDQLLGSFDFKQGKLSYAGWTKQSSMSFEQAAEGLAEIIITDTDRDGTLGGPNLELLQSIKDRCSAKLVVAGGIRDENDILALKRMGMDGVIIGKAFLENKLSLRNIFKFEEWEVD